MRIASLVAGLLTLLALALLFRQDGSTRLRVDTSVEALTTADTPDAKTSATLLALLEAPKRLTPDDVVEVARITRALRRLPNVMEVESPATTSLPSVDDDNIMNSSLYEQVQDQPERAEASILAALADPLLAGQLVSRDGRTAVFVIQLGWLDAEAALAAAQLVQTQFLTLSSESGRYRSVVTGAPLVKAELAGLVRGNLRTVVVLSLLIAPLLLAIAFKGLVNVLLPLMTLAAAVLWTLAGMATVGISINLVTAIVVPLVMAVTLGYSIHAMSAFAETRLAARALRFLAPPLVLSGLTTMAGLLALSLQPLSAIREFGFAAAFGVFCGLLAVGTVLCPAVLLGRISVEKRPQLNELLGRLATFSSNGDTPQRRRRIIYVATALVGLGMAGSLLIIPSTHYVRDLPVEHPIRLDFESVNHALGGSNMFEIVIEGAGPDAVLLPTVLHAADGLQQWLNRHPQVGGTLSLTDFLKRLNQVMSGGEPEAHQIPDSLAKTKQLLIIAAPPTIYQYTDLDFSHLIIRVRTPLDATADLSTLFEEINLRLDQMPTGVTATLRGDLVTLTDTIRKLTSGQVMSVGLAFIAIYLVLAAVFSSFTAALRALLPNAVPVAMFYGIVGFAGIPLGPTTALVTCIVFGIAVDDTLFYLVHFSRSARKVASETVAAKRTLREVISPVTLTTAIMCLSFLTLATSPFHSQAVFAGMAALTLAIAWVCDLTLTPAVAANSGIVTLWDVLRLDLGTQPERTIPLFHDMTPRQARIFALLSQMQNVPAGQKFIEEGDTGREMYVVVEGEASASLVRGGQAVELGRFKRGDTLGEAGSFNRKRTADVTALENCRVLVFDATSLERLRRRYPGIAALAFRNLNRIQADRLAKTTRRLHGVMQETGQFPASP